MTKLSVLIPDGENEHVLWVTRCLAHSERVKLHILSGRRWMPVRFSRYHQIYETRPTGTDAQARLEAITSLAQRIQPDVILPVSEEGVLFAITEQVALSKLAALPPLPSLEALNTARNKWLLNQFAKQHNLPVPDSLLITLEPGLEQRLAQLQYPVLLKPTHSTDGQGIRRFETFAELQSFIRSNSQILSEKKYLVQSYMPGFDMGFSVLCREGQILAFTVQRGLISAAHRFGPLMALEIIQSSEVQALGQTLMSALGWSGVAHVDLRCDSRDGQIKILEINARYWGSLLGSLVAGINFPYLACLTALGQSFPLPAYQTSTYAHTTTAIKEGLLSLFGKGHLSRLNLGDSGLRFFLVDPLPEIVKRVQEKFCG